jgi:hypothetical protein
VPNDTTVSGLMVVLRGKLKISETQAIYLCTKEDNGVSSMLVGSQRVGEIYDRLKSHDGFLYLKCCSENVFGG